MVGPLRRAIVAAVFGQGALFVCDGGRIDAQLFAHQIAMRDRRAVLDAGTGDSVVMGRILSHRG
jgi:phospholipid N-methyltransferase